ncbi:MAG: 3-deoxy-7-phosphoheptulonate synthase [Melioribacteraceae bacterium]|nr:MAG: 3-deoxy-7-phosphoheptulonate synthase [Melioribacteraceae bacterium]
MLILMNLDAPRNDIESVKKKVVSFGCTAHEIPGASRLAIGLTGPTGTLKTEDFMIMDSVEDVVRVTKKYKLVSRMMKEDDTVIDFGGTSTGGKELTIIAGPCSVENRDQIFTIAEQLAKLGIKFMRAGAYKPRSSPYSFQGLKEKGIELLGQVKEQYGLKIVTEVLDPYTIDGVGEVADVFQIGARNMQNFSLLDAVGKTGKPVLLKRGMSATVEDLLLSAEYILAHNNFNVMLCERGIRTFETATRNTLDLNAVPVIKKHSHLPIIVDPSHGIGIGDKVPAMSLAAVAAGADGLILEVHNDPANAMSDGYQSLNFDQFERLLNKIKQLAPIVDKELIL